MSLIDEFQQNGPNSETGETRGRNRRNHFAEKFENFKYRTRHRPTMRCGAGVADSVYWMKAVLSRLLTEARGAARPLAIALLEQLPELRTLGMPPEASLREALQIAIHAARLKARHCVGDERLVFEDFIALCLEMESVFASLSPT